MIFISICVGSSCYLKGSEKLITLFKNKVEAEGLDGKVILSGRFCSGKCNRVGVTVSIGNGMDEEVITGITPDGFEAFWVNVVQPKLCEV